MPMSEARRCLTIKFTIFLMLAVVAFAQFQDNNSVIGPITANGSVAAGFRKYILYQF